jgi:Fic family protein
MSNTNQPDNNTDDQTEEKDEYTVPARVRALSEALRLAGVHAKVKRGIIADKANVSDDTASRALQDARELGWLHRHGSGRHNHYISNQAGSIGTGLVRNECDECEKQLNFSKQLTER